MNDMIEKLTNELLERNSMLSSSQARAWIELLWEDFQATYAKTGSYHGEEMTENVVRAWIQNHGPRLHEIRTNNPKYAHLINRDDHTTH